MLRFKLASLRPTEKKVTNVTPVAAYQEIGNVPAMMTEAFRRNKIVKKMFEECPYRENDKVVCTNPNDAWGQNIIVEKICSTYNQLGVSEKWPANDQPMIVQAWSIDKLARFFCTPNYLKKV